jgi:serine/threonine-protein kinase
VVEYTPQILANRYEVGDLIGRGGMAEVHVGRDTRLGRTVAIKVLRSDLARDPAFQARFRREAQAAASLNHPAIVAVYDTGEDTSTDPAGQTVRIPYIIMEYVEGHTLRELMRDGAALPIDEAIDITIGVLSALQYAHHEGIVHRDIKPANIMLTAAGQVKVMDFGIARALADSSATMTQSQNVIGTAQYLSPEQARGEQVDARSDLYSTGCVLYELLTGRPPFVGDSAVAVAYQHVREQPAPPSTLAPDVPEVLDRIVLKALAKDRDLRYSTASEFRGDLETAKRGGLVPGLAPTAATLPVAQPTAVMRPPSAQPIGAGAPPAQYPPSPFPVPVGAGGSQPGAEDEEAETDKRRWLIIGIIAAAVLIALGIIIFALVQGGGEGGPSESPSVSGSPTASPQAVPEVQPGMTFEQAKAALEDLGFEAMEVPTPDATVPEGEVIGFEPASGQMATPPAQVKVLVSTGPDSVVVPDVKGLSQSEARELIEKDDKLKAGDVDTTWSADVPSGFAVETDPAIGEEVPEGTTVKILLSNGTTKVPDLVGRTEAKARELISRRGLVTAEAVEEISERDPGTVIRQSLEAGTFAPQGQQMTITVARAAKEIEVPSVEGLARDTAIKAITDAGLPKPDVKYIYDDVWPTGTAVRTDPEEGEMARENQTITLFVSNGPAQASTTPPATETPTPAPVVPTDTATPDPAAPTDSGTGG